MSGPCRKGRAPMCMLKTPQQLKKKKKKSHQAKYVTTQAKWPMRKATHRHTERKVKACVLMVYIYWDPHVYSCTGLRFPLCDIWEKNEALMDINFQQKLSFSKNQTRQ